MAFFKQTQKPSEGMDDCEHLSALGADPEAWDDLDDEELKQVIAMKCIEYGATQDSSLIPGLFALYRHAMERLDVGERREMLTEFSHIIEQNDGLGHMGLMMFLAADTDPGIRSSAALSLSVLFDPADGDELAGPRFVIRTLVRHDNGSPGQGAALGGVLLLGDKRIMPLLAEVWDELSEEAQLEMTAAKSGFVSEGVVEFWLDRLEGGCSEAVFGRQSQPLPRCRSSPKCPSCSISSAYCPPTPTASRWLCCAAPYSTNTLRKSARGWRHWRLRNRSQSSSHAFSRSGMIRIPSGGWSVESRRASSI